MSTASIRDLRNHGGEVVDRASRGERVVITRNGEPVAELRPLARPPFGLHALRRRWVTLPAVDPEALGRDLDAAVDPGIW